jgi:phosphoenolpyruvate carboxylase
MRKIPKTMSTQHPDNARVPEWARSEVIEGDDEVIEAYYSYMTLGTHEVMWDAEGKDVDTHVVRKLLSNYSEYFKENILGQEIFLTYRLPNPKIEGAERKVFAETMESIPIAYDVAEKFYGKKIIPVFEVILPFTTDYSEIVEVAKYYEKAVSGKENIELADGIYVKDFVGEINPKKVEVIPLIEDKDSLLKVEDIVSGYYKAIRPNYMRVFIARSDPAMNYGMLSAVLLAKYALSKLYKLKSKLNIEIFPIIGVGSLPFRGHLSPDNYENHLKEYKGVYTFTIQSAYKYDYNENKVKESVNNINKTEIVEPLIFSEEEEKILKRVIEKYVAAYQPIIESLAPVINYIAFFLPKRRARKLHISLFGYARSTGKVTLPRAITFVGTLYSIGLPPEIFGISSLLSLSNEEMDLLNKSYIMMKKDLEESAKYINLDSLDLIRKIWNIDENIIKMIENDIAFLEDNLGIKIDNKDFNSKKHVLLSSLLLLACKEKRDEEIKQYAKEMALIRKSIG